MTRSIKNTIRMHNEQTRRALPQAEQDAAAQAVCKQIHALTVYQQARHIAFYQAISGELDLSALWTQACTEGKLCYMPLMHDNKTLSFLPTTPDTPYRINKLNIREPDVALTNTIAPHQIDLMLIPLVAFDDQGTRLGRGAGYYDRTLAKERPYCLLGAAYAFQHQLFIQAEPWDVPLTGVVTELGVTWYK